jgi:hypothetical protein
MAGEIQTETGTMRIATPAVKGTRIEATGIRIIKATETIKEIGAMTAITKARGTMMKETTETIVIIVIVSIATMKTAMGMIADFITTTKDTVITTKETSRITGTMEEAALHILLTNHMGAEGIPDRTNTREIMTTETGKKE